MDSSGVLEVEEIAPGKFGYSSIRIGYKKPRFYSATMKQSASHAKAACLRRVMVT